MPNHLNYTVEQIKTVIKMWEGNTLQQIADTLGLPKPRIYFIAQQIKKAGHKLPPRPRHDRGSLKRILRELWLERGGDNENK